MSSGVFATLEPLNELAKLTFSNAVDQTSAQPSEAHALRRYMHIRNQPGHDHDVCRFLRRPLDGGESATDTEAETDTEDVDGVQCSSRTIWKGHYTFQYSTFPKSFKRGWV